MATVIWTGATDGVVTTGTNYVGGAAPSGGDSVISDRQVTNDMTSGTHPALVDFVVTPGSNLKIGSGVAFGNITGKLELAGTGSSYYISSSGTVATLNAFASKGGPITIAAGTFTTVRAQDCRLDFAAAAIATTIDNQGAQITAGTNSTAVTTYTGYGSFTCNARNITTANLDGPRSTLITTGNTTGTGASTGAVATCNIIAGATFNCLSAATNTTANIRGRNSVYTVANNPNPAGALTTANLWSGASLISVQGGHTTTVTTTNYVGYPTGLAPVQ